MYTFARVRHVYVHVLMCDVPALSATQRRAPRPIIQHIQSHAYTPDVVENGASEALAVLRTRLLLSAQHACFLGESEGEDEEEGVGRQWTELVVLRALLRACPTVLLVPQQQQQPSFNQGHMSPVPLPEAAPAEGLQQQQQQQLAPFLPMLQRALAPPSMGGPLYDATRPALRFAAVEVRKGV